MRIIIFLLTILILNTIPTLAADVTDGLVARWSFNDAAGSTAYDFSGLGNTAYLSGTTWVSGKMGTAVLLGGNSSYVQVPVTGSKLNSSLQNIETQGANQNNQFGLSMSLWLNPSNLTQSNIYNPTVLLEKTLGYQTGFAVIYYVTISPTGLCFQRGYSTTGLKACFSTPNLLNVWTHLVLTWDGTSNASDVNLYVNGNVVAGSNLVNGVGTPTTDDAGDTGGIKIGSSIYGGNNITGVLDETRIYNRALLQSEVNILYAQGANSVSYPPPTVVITAPANNATLTDTVNLTATVQDNSATGAGGVLFKVVDSNNNVTQIGAEATTPSSMNGSLYTYQIPWNTFNFANGTYTLTAQGFDNVGDIGVATTMSVTINNRHTSPVISNPLPSGTLAMGTNNASVTVTTDENANCNYAPIAGIPYAQMPNTFTTTGGTTHSFNMVNLINGESVNYYVRCQDHDGNTDVADYPISFNVANGSGETVTISGVTMGRVFPSSATVIWQTSDNANGQIEYGLTSNYGSATGYSSSFNTSNSAVILGLTPNTLYHYRIDATAQASGIQSTSMDYTFTTNPSGNNSPIDPKYRINWHPGIPGGIPQYPLSGGKIINVTQAPYNTPIDGVSDAAPGINAAVSAANPGDVVYIPAGKYELLSNSINISSGIVLRGAGPQKTILQMPGDQGDVISVGPVPNYNSVSTPIVSGAVKNSNVISISSNLNSSGQPIYMAGQYVIIDQNNDPALGSMQYAQASNSEPQTVAQINQIQSVNGNNLTLVNTINYTFNANMNIEVTNLNMLAGVGIENLQVDRSNRPVVAKAGSWSENNIDLSSCVQCWIKNIQTTKVWNWHVSLNESYECEVVNSFFYDGWDHGGNASYGVTLNRSTDNLIENNSFYILRHSMAMQWGGTGNVFDYNVTDADWGDSGSHWLTESIALHGGDPYMNLFESNEVSAQISGDDTQGGGFSNTFFRNYAHAISHPELANPPYPNEYVAYNLIAVDVQNSHYYENMVGNVLGMPASGTPLADPTTSNNGDSGWPTLGAICCEDAAPYDSLTQATFLGHGNYDYFTQVPASENGQYPQQIYIPSSTSSSTAPLGVAWYPDPNVSQVLPVSYFLITKPGFLQNSAWPLYGPESSLRDPVTNNLLFHLPARDRLNVITSTIAVAPTVPNNVMATVSGNNVNLNWDASWATSNVLVTGDINGYAVYRDGVQIGTVDNSMTQNTTYLDSGVNFSSTHNYQVLAIDGAGNRSNLSSAITVSSTGVTNTNIAYGDVTGTDALTNGIPTITMADAQLTAQAAIGEQSLTTNQQQNAQVDGTGKVNIYDAYLIAQRAANLITIFPAQGG